MAHKFESVSPLAFVVGDRLNCHGAIVRLVTLNRRPCDIKGGIETVSGLAILENDNEPGSIPAAYWDTLEYMAMRGVDVTGLPAGRYWTVQGNDHARFTRVIPAAREPQFVMTASARKYALELQGFAQTRYHQARVATCHYLDEMAHHFAGDDDKREMVLAIQRNAHATYARMRDVMGLAD